jgi:ApaG protein
VETLITKGIKISVETSYQAAYSKPVEEQFIFAYHIAIENLSSQTVQLLSRHWIIWDSVGIIREVEGEGVIGRQPTLSPGESHQYNSWCPLRTPMGKMHGSFLMEDQVSLLSFRVPIPEFKLIAPFISN